MNLLDEDDFQAVPHFRRHLLGILLVLGGKKHGLDASSVCADELLFDSSDPLDMTRQLELSLFQGISYFPP